MLLGTYDIYITCHLLFQDITELSFDMAQMTSNRLQAVKSDAIGFDLEPVYYFWRRFHDLFDRDET